MGKKIELTGQIIGRLTVIEEDFEREAQETLQGKKKRRRWMCKCECGRMVSISQDNLTGKRPTQSCGCLSREKASQRFIDMNQSNASDLTGKVFNRLTAQFPIPERKHGAVVWHCKCVCGTECDIRSDQLVSGAVQSCGCLQKERVAEIGKSHARDISGMIFGCLQAVSPTSKRDGKSVIWICHCLNCGNNAYEASVSDLTFGNTKSCGCLKSIGEFNITQLLQNSNIEFQKEKSFDNLISDRGHRYRYDFYLPQYNRLIEFDGEQHYKYKDSGWSTKEYFERTQKSDKIKNEYALSNNIDLVRIPYWERDNITLDMLLGDNYLVKD